MGHEGSMESFFSGLSSTAFLMSVSLLYALAGIVVFMLWYRRLKRETQDSQNRDSLKGYGIKMYAGMILFAVSAQYLCEYLVTILSKMQPQWLEMYMKLMEDMELSGGRADVLLIAYVVLLGPVCEELCFRGVTLGLCKKVMPLSSANIVQALLFGGMHANPLQSIYAFAFGWLLGQIYLDTGNLTITIIVHILFNGAGIALAQYIGVGATPATFFAMLLAAMLLVYFSFSVIRSAASVRPSEE